MNEIGDFLEYLSMRMRNENSLSDITWALCESSDKFQNLFLTYVFGEDDNNYSQITEFQREYSRGNSRPDLYFKYKEKEYIIEVKINDRNQHFDQYNNTFPDAIKGYITNYPMQKQVGYKIKNWEDFLKFLNKNLNNEDDIFLNLIKGYISYVENVCNIKKIEKMRLNEITSLFYLINSIDKIIEIDNDEIFVTRYTQTDKSWNGRQGRCFQLTFNNKKIDDIWGWFGLYYNEQTILCIEFDKNEGWGQPIYELLSNNKELKDGEYFSEPYEEEGAYYFELKEEKLKAFEVEENSDNQFQIIHSFFNEVINFLNKLTNR